MIFDTDILIWLQRGNEKAAKAINNSTEKNISIQTYMELMQCAPSKKHQTFIKKMLSELNFKTLALSENISHRAAIYIEQFSSSTGIRSGDAIIAATAAEHNQPILTGNRKHFQKIPEIDLKVFKH